MDGSTELRACARCGAWERVACRHPGRRPAPATDARWSDGFHDATGAAQAVRCPTCREVHLPVALEGPSGLSCVLVLVGGLLAGVAAAGACRPQALAPVALVGGFLLGAVALSLVAAVVGEVLGGLRRLRARWRGVQLAPEATPDEVIAALRGGLAPSGEEELELRRDAWWRSNHHDRPAPATTRADAERLVRAAARAAGRPRLQTSPGALALLTGPRSVAAAERLPALLAEAVRAAGDRLEVRDLPAALREPPPPSPRPAWWTDNLRRLVDLLGATTPEARQVKAEAARALGDRDLARRLLADALPGEEPELRAWHQLLVEGDDPRVARVPDAVAAKGTPPRTDGCRAS